MHNHSFDFKNLQKQETSDREQLRHHFLSGDTENI